MAKHDPDLSRIFQALADPTRRAILAQLIHGPAPVTRLAAPTGMALPTVLRHLSVLEGAALITSSKSGRQRICALHPETLTLTEDWLSAQRRLWETRTDQLETLLATLNESPSDDPL